MKTIRMQHASTRSRVPVALGAALLATFAVGCGFVREVRRTQTGGEIAIRGRTSGTEKEAADLMTARCNGAYDIVEEGEVVVGQQTVTSSQGQGTVMQQQNRNHQVTHVNTYSQGTSTTQNTTEWRILYQCKSAGPASPAPAAAPADGAPGAVPGAPAPAAPPAPAAQPRPESRLHELRLRF